MQTFGCNGTITGKVLLRNGMPAVGMRVVALAAREGPATTQSTLMSLTQTDAQGRYRLEDVPPGVYG